MPLQKKKMKKSKLLFLFTAVSIGMSSLTLTGCAKPSGSESSNAPATAQGKKEKTVYGHFNKDGLYRFEYANRDIEDILNTEFSEYITSADGKVRVMKSALGDETCYVLNKNLVVEFSDDAYRSLDIHIRSRNGIDDSSETTELGGKIMGSLVSAYGGYPSMDELTQDTFNRYETYLANLSSDNGTTAYGAKANDGLLMTMLYEYTPSTLYVTLGVNETTFKNDEAFLKAESQVAKSYGIAEDGTVVYPAIDAPSVQPLFFHENGDISDLWDVVDGKVSE